MRIPYLKIIVMLSAFSLGIGSVWTFGSPSGLFSLFDEKAPSVSQITVRTNGSPRPAELIKTENTFLNGMPRFEDYPVTKIYSGKTARLKFAENEFGDRARFQFAINNQTVNFAGHYIVTNWSCGMWCSHFAVIDARTGKVFSLNVNPDVCLANSDKEFACNENFSSINHKTDSSLIVVFGFRYDNNPDGEKGFHYYKFVNGRFVHLNSLLVKDQRSARQVQLEEFVEKSN